MALAGKNLGDAVSAAMKTKFIDPLVASGKMTSSEAQDAYNNLKESWETVGAALVTYLTANTVVNTTVAAGIPVATTGSAVAQSGSTTSTGAGIGTIS